MGGMPETIPVDEDEDVASDALADGGHDDVNTSGDRAHMPEQREGARLITCKLERTVVLEMLAGGVGIHEIFGPKHKIICIGSKESGEFGIFFERISGLMILPEDKFNISTCKAGDFIRFEVDQPKVYTIPLTKDEIAQAVQRNPRILDDVFVLEVTPEAMLRYVMARAHRGFICEVRVILAPATEEEDDSFNYFLQPRSLPEGATPLPGDMVNFIPQTDDRRLRGLGSGR